MDYKEYLTTNHKPVISEMKNVFVLLWLERAGCASATEIANATNISESTINKILHTLFINELIDISENAYVITEAGINFLDSIGYSDLYISSLLSETEFKEIEYDLYNEILLEYRKENLKLYRFIMHYVRNEKNRSEKEFNMLSVGDTPLSEKEYFTFFLVDLLHEVGHTLYNNNVKNSSLIRVYNKLYEASRLKHLFSSERYHAKATGNWSRIKSRDNIYLIISLRNTENYTHYLTENMFCSEIKEIQLYVSYDLNRDLMISHKLFLQDNFFLRNMFSSFNIKELSQKLNLTEVQTKFVLKVLQAKIADLLNEPDQKLLSENE